MCVGGEEKRTREEEEDEKSLPCSDRMRSGSVFSLESFRRTSGMPGFSEIEIEPRGPSLGSKTVNCEQEEK